MTLPYGLTPIGMKDQFIQDGHFEGIPDPQKSASFLRDLVMAAIGGVVVKSVEYMGWLKKVAAIANEQSVALSWTTPLEMRVTQDYVKPTSVSVRLPGLGQVLFRKCPELARKLNASKQTNGICPNFIHSHDAAHLMLTVNGCRAEGVTQFWPVHDSFGTYAPQIPTLNRVLREQFIGMYKENPLERFAKETEARLGKALPPLPQRGTLDLARIKESPYFFG